MKLVDNFSPFYTSYETGSKLIDILSPDMLSNNNIERAEKTLTPIRKCYRVVLYLATWCYLKPTSIGYVSLDGLACEVILDGTWGHGWQPVRFLPSYPTNKNKQTAACKCAGTCQWQLKINQN